MYMLLEIIQPKNWICKKKKTLTNTQKCDREKEGEKYEIR